MATTSQNRQHPLRTLLIFLACTAALYAIMAVNNIWTPKLGLDLRGGAHLLGEVHVADVYKSRMTALWPELRQALAAQRDVVGAVLCSASSVFMS